MLICVQVFACFQVAMEYFTANHGAGREGSAPAPPGRHGAELAAPHLLEEQAGERAARIVSELEEAVPDGSGVEDLYWRPPGAAASSNPSHRKTRRSSVGLVAKTPFLFLRSISALPNGIGSKK